MSTTIKGNILTPGGWIGGALHFGQRVENVDGGAVAPSSNGDDYIIPGFIDLHVHGGGGRDVMEGGDAPHIIAAIHARHGTTSMLATTMTAPPEDIVAALRAVGAACADRRARLLERGVGMSARRRGSRAGATRHPR